MKLSTRTHVRALRLLLWATAASGTSAHAAVTLNPLFGNHMVLQRDRPLPVWGTAGAREPVAVTFNGETKTTTAGNDGKWLVTLSPQAVSAAPKTLAVHGSSDLTLTDVLVGDVWLGTGQSNMAFTVSGTDGKDRIAKSAASQFEGIRLFKAEEIAADQPVEAVKGDWLPATPQSISRFSATLFFFGEALRERLPGVPLGLVVSSVGATNIFSWIPNEVRDQDPATAYLREWWTRATRSWTPEKQAERDKANQEYDAKVADYKTRKEPLPEELKRPPGELMGPKYSRRPSAFYNGMIAPLEPLAVRGVIWYQGEWDSKHDWVKVYHDEFAAMAKSWRAHWAQAAGNDPKLGDFPIYLVQLPSREPGDGNFWPYLREAEAKLATDVPKSGYVATYDTNAGGANLHPPEKTEIGRRLARLAAALEYGQKVAYHGPAMTSATMQGGRVVVSFDAGAEALKSADGQPLRDFELAGADGKYVPAVAELRGNTVVVSAATLANPSTVRYAFSPAPDHPNFINSEGLPAAPFRTDEQPSPP